MYYFEKYDSNVLFISMAGYSIILIILLKKKISSFIDPLTLHLVWCASGMALLTGYFVAKGISIDGFLFILVYLFYLIGLKLFLNKTNDKPIDLLNILNDKRNIKLFVICLVLNLVSRYEFISYAVDNPSILEWFLYKFRQTEKRDFTQYILQIGARPFFIYYLFVLIKTKRDWRLILIIILLVNVLLDIFAGGRSSIIGLILAYGYFVHRFHPLFTKMAIRQLNWYSISFVFFAVLAGAIITSFYTTDSTVEDGVLSMINRLLAAGDGLEMYLINNGGDHIRSGINEYVKSVFGIFLKRVVDVQAQSVGWQLYELENGVVSPFAVGPNYILPLQAFVLGKSFVIPYPLFISFIVSFLRGNAFTTKFKFSPELSFVIGILSFEPALDIELFVLTLCACLSIYGIFIYPFKKFKFVFDWYNVFLKRKLRI